MPLPSGTQGTGTNRWSDTSIGRNGVIRRYEQPCGLAADLTQHLPHRSTRLPVPPLSGLQVILGVNLFEPHRACLVQQRDAITGRGGDLHGVGSERERTIASGSGVPFVAQAWVVLAHEDG
jgi:hypothetical protein